MARPRTGSNQALEKALTRTICQHIRLQSGLSFAELDEVFSLGGVNENGRKTGRTFSRYSESDPEKSRAASRDTLSRIVKIAAQKGWITDQVIQQWGANKTLVLDKNHKEVKSFFMERRVERDKVELKIRQLQKVCTEAKTLLSNLQYVIPAQIVDGPHTDKIVMLQDYHYATDINNPKHKFYNVRPPASLQQALDWLEVHLDRSTLMMRGGGLDPIPQINESLLVQVLKVPKVPNEPLPIDDFQCDVSDIYQLLSEVEKWCITD